jgi:deoxycytidine triphosphate deaminase
MILGAAAIHDALHEGAILCDPAPARIEGAHIDITLGRFSWVAQLFIGDSRLTLATADPARLFAPEEAQERVLIPPHGFILAHTEEYIGTAPGSGLVPMLHTRSTLARWGLSVCTANAGQGDEGYCSRWTLEIVNPHPVAVALPVGGRIGAITFHRVQGAAPAYEGRYNVPRPAWEPSSMLPRKGNW